MMGPATERMPQAKADLKGSGAKTGKRKSKVPVRGPVFPDHFASIQNGGSGLACRCRQAGPLDVQGETGIVFVDGSKPRMEYTGAATAVFSDRGPSPQRTRRIPVKPKK
jgi:hypothetical protein